MFTVKEITEATGGSIISGKRTELPGVSTDTRTLKEGVLFIPLKGIHYDGHSFIMEAIRKGAGGILIEENHPLKKGILEKVRSQPISIILVDNTLKALQDLAGYHRRKFDIPVVGITGSNGKTTTKEMVWSILAHKASILKNQGNFNNHIGVPLTLLELMPVHEGLVIEMGISNPGELSELCRIGQPTCGAIINVGPTHLETLKNIENVALAKSEILNFIPSNGFCVLNRDDQFFDIFKRKSSARIISFGMSREADIYPEDIAINTARRDHTLSFTLVMPPGKVYINLHVLGIHNIYNALCAAAIATGLGTQIEDIKYGLENFRPVRMRSETEEIGPFTLINDAYNANPASMVAAINMLTGFKRGRKIAVLGDMLELGESSLRAHREVGLYAATMGIDVLIVTGKFAEHTAEGALEGGMEEERVIICNNITSCLEAIKKHIQRGDIILIKGSRKMHMEAIMEGLKEGL